MQTAPAISTGFRKGYERIISDCWVYQYTSVDSARGQVFGPIEVRIAIECIFITQRFLVRVILSCTAPSSRTSSDVNYVLSWGSFPYGRRIATDLAHPVMDSPEYWITLSAPSFYPSQHLLHNRRCFKLSLLTVVFLFIFFLFPYFSSFPLLGRRCVTDSGDLLPQIDAHQRIPDRPFIFGATANANCSYHPIVLAQVHT